MQDTRHTKYLGLPSFIGRSKKQVFPTLKERIGHKLASWKGKLLSMGGKEILIKAVAQAIPTYNMGCFLLPQSLCDDIESMMRNFWWGQRQQENKICWVSWKTMCKQKANWDMGFKNLQAFNKALLAKQLWCILQNPNTLVAKVLRVRYFPTGDILNANIGNSPSYSWRTIHSSLEVIRKGTRWRGGNGKLIHIWDDKWLPTPSTYKIISPPNNIPHFPMVSSPIDPMTKWWNVSTIRASFLPFEVETILKIPLSHDLPEDKIIWIGYSRGNFTVKSAYHLALNLLDSDGNEECLTRDMCKLIWRKLWRLNLPPKIKIFAWRACINGLPTMEAINHRGISHSKACPVCKNEAESIDHALLDCVFSSSVWNLWPENLLSSMVLSSLSLTLPSLFSPTQHSKSLSFSLLLLGPFGSIETSLLMRGAGSLLIRSGSWRKVVLKIMRVRHYGISVNQGLPQPVGFLPPMGFIK